MNIVRLFKHGNSTVITIPPAYQARLEVYRGDFVKMELTVKGLLISKLRKEVREDVLSNEV